MIVWIVIGGTHYESSEWIEGVFSSKEKAEEKLSTMQEDSLNFAYMEECEVE